MIPIIQSFDAWTESQYPALNKKLWGYTELVHRMESGSDQPIPVTINNTSDREQVALDDTYQLITWFRLPGQVLLQNELDGNDWSFGLQDSPVQRAGLRWVIAHRVEIGDDWIFTFLNNIPGGFKIADYQMVYNKRKQMVLDADHETIYLTELGRTCYEKHRFTWNLYVINLNVEYVPCIGANAGVCCTESLLTESGDCLIQE